MRFSKKQVA